MVPELRIILLVALIVLGPSVTAVAQAPCVDEVVDAELTVRVDLTSRDDASSRAIQVAITGDGAPVPLSLNSGDEVTVTVPAGTYEYSASAAGFESRSGTLSLCESSSLTVRLVPTQLVTLSGTVFAGDDVSSDGSRGTSIVLTGHDERNGAVIREVVDEDGTYSVEDVPAGFYSVEFELERASASESRTEFLGLRLPFVDVLGDSQVDARLVSNFDQGDAELNAACSIGGAGLPSRGGAVVAMIALGFIFWRRRVRS